MTINFIAREAVYADSMIYVGLSEDKVPCRVGIEVGHCDPKQGKAVARKTLSKQVQNACGEQLQAARRGMIAIHDSVPGKIKSWQQLHLQLEKRGSEFTKLIQRRAIQSGEISERLKIQMIAACIRPVQTGIQTFDRVPDDWKANHADRSGRRLEITPMDQTAGEALQEDPPSVRWRSQG